jgi:hypothetical protein
VFPFAATFFQFDQRWRSLCHCPHAPSSCARHSLETPRSPRLGVSFLRLCLGRAPRVKGETPQWRRDEVPRPKPAKPGVGEALFPHGSALALRALINSIQL